MADERHTYGLANGPRIDEITGWDDAPVRLTLNEAQSQADAVGLPLMVRVGGEWQEADRG